MLLAPGICQQEPAPCKAGCMPAASVLRRGTQPRHPQTRKPDHLGKREQLALGRVHQMAKGLPMRQSGYEVSESITQKLSGTKPEVVGASSNIEKWLVGGASVRAHPQHAPHPHACPLSFQITESSRTALGLILFSSRPKVLQGEPRLQMWVYTTKQYNRSKEDKSGFCLS